MYLELVRFVLVVGIVEGAKPSLIRQDARAGRSESISTKSHHKEEYVGEGQKDAEGVGIV
jgi:hypothetical protein